MHNYRLPAEWEPQSGIMLTWPHAGTDWQPILSSVEPVFAEICRACSRHQKVLVVANNALHRKHIKDLLAKSGAVETNIIYGEARSNDSWARDHGPITVLEGNEPVLLDFQFNGWGKKHPYNLDNQINFSLYNDRVFQDIAIKPVNLVLEGGAIESNGEGTLLTTTCLLTPTRNATINQHAMEASLRENFGVQTVHWLTHKGLSGDDTDGHIDTLARFTDANTIVYCQCEDSSDSEYDGLNSLEQQLQQLRNTRGDPYQLVPVPLPAAITNRLGDRLPATYANFLIINESILLPLYECDTDEAAVSTLQSLFPSREIVGINCLPLIEQFGSLHCVTMQLPRGVI